MSSHKKLLRSIKEIETKIDAEKLKLAKHRRYFKNFTEKNSTILLSLLLPTFLAGWQAGKTTESGKKLKQLSKFIFLTTLTNLPK